MLVVRSRTLLPSLIVITLGPVAKDDVRRVLTKHVPFREVVERTFMDKAGDWLARTFPLEKN